MVESEASDGRPKRYLLCLLASRSALPRRGVRRRGMPCRTCQKVRSVRSDSLVQRCCDVVQQSATIMAWAQLALQQNLKRSKDRHPSRPRIESTASMSLIGMAHLGTTSSCVLAHRSAKEEGRNGSLPVCRRLEAISRFQEPCDRSSILIAAGFSCGRKMPLSSVLPTHGAPNTGSSTKPSSGKSQASRMQWKSA